MKKNEMLFEKRKQLAIEKGLIKDNDYKIYRHILNLYKLGFETLLSTIIDFEKMDRVIESSNLYFSPSTNAQKFLKDSNLKSKYIYCLNQFYIEKLSQKYIEILKNSNTLTNEVLLIIKNTFQDIITKDGVENITYGPTTPERIIKNQTIVLELIFGRTIYEATTNLYLENHKKQNELIDKIINNIELTLKNTLNTNTKVLVSKSL